MILQALVSIALVAVIAGAILTSALVSATVAAHQTATRLGTTALARGTDEFVNWAQRYVAKHGAASAFPTTVVTDQPVAACAADETATTTCSLFLSVSYRVLASGAAQSTGPDTATNLQGAVDENRIAAEVDATITNATGAVIATAQQNVTARVFNAPPFAVVLGVRTPLAIAGSETASQGDTGGQSVLKVETIGSTPDPHLPNAITDTEISVTMDCANSVTNSDLRHPLSNNNAPGNDSLPWGATGGKAFGAPCAPDYVFSNSPAIPTDASLPAGNIYKIDFFSNRLWNASEYSK